MNEKAAHLSARLLGKPWERASELEPRVLHALAARAHVSRPIHRELEAGLTPGQRQADRVAAFGGSCSLIMLFFVTLTAWMALNSLLLARRAFDPYPYILLNLVLSCLASIQAPLILMSQNRQAEKDRARAAHDYEVNLKAELEIMQLLEKVETLRGVLREMQSRGAGAS